MTTSSASTFRDGPDDRSVSSQISDARGIRSLLAALLALHVVVALYLAKSMVLPVVLGFLIALALSPLARYFQRLGAPPPIVAAALIGGLGGAFLISSYSVSDSVATWIEDAPSLGAQVRERLVPVSESVEAVKSATEDVQKIASQTSPGVTKVSIAQPGLLESAFLNLAGLGTTIAVALVLALFILSSGTLFYEKLVSSFASLSGKKGALGAVYDLQRKISRYLFTITLINAALGVSIGAAAYLIGLPNPIIWGAAAFALNYMPFLGTVIGTALIGAVSIVTFDDLGYAFLAPAVYLALGTLEGQIISPAVVGKSLKINTVSVFLSVIFWGWLWGLAGTLLAVPILVVVKVICDGVPSLRRVGSFLDSEPEVQRDHSFSNSR